MERTFQWWMVSFIGFGAGFFAFVSLLIPPFVTKATGNAAEAGVVMAVISLAAVLGPVLGSFADRYRAHRLVLSLGLFGMASAFGLYALSAGDAAVTVLDAIVMGTSIAAIQAVAPVFIIGADLPQALQAKRLTMLNLMAPVGQVVGGAMLGVAAQAGWSFQQRFWLAAITVGAAGVVTLLTTAGPASRIIAARSDSLHETAPKPGLRNVLLSMFGVYLVVLVLSSVASNGVNSQIANILPNVYGIDEATTSGLISLAGVLNIVGFLAAGAWMARSGAMPGFAGAQVMRLAGVLLLALLGLLTDAPVLIVAAAMQLFYFSNPFSRLAQPVLAVQVATVPAGAASGWVIGAAAVGSFIGSVVGGWLAEAVGFNAINWMGAVAVGAALALLLATLVPAERRRRRAEPEGAGR